MSRHFEFEPFRKQDADGKLLAVGANWNEKTATISHNRGPSIFVIIFGLFFVGIGLFAAAKGAQAAVPWAFGGFGSLFIILGLSLGYGAAPKRAIIMRADGSISTPYGIPGHSNSVDWTRFRTEDIHSFEVAGPPPTGQMLYEKRVNVLMSSGDTLHLSHHLFEEHARKIVMQLTAALKALREAQEQAKREAAASEPVRKIS